MGKHPNLIYDQHTSVNISVIIYLYQRSIDMDTLLSTVGEIEYNSVELFRLLEYIMKFSSVYMVQELYALVLC